MLTGLCFALAAMVLNTVAGLSQSHATSRVSRQRDLVTQPGYLAGLACDAGGWACTVVALRHLPVFAVQGVLGGVIVVTAITARLLHQAQLRRADLYAIGCCLVGLVVVAASADADQPPPAPASAYVAMFLGAGVLAVTMVWVWRGPRAWPLAMVAGLGLGGTSLAVRAVRVPTAMNAGLLDLLFQPAAYLVVLLWVIGILGYTRALRIGTLTRITAVFQVTEVVVPGLVGIVLLNDRVRPGWELPMAVGLVLATAGVLALARSPAAQPPEPAPVR